MNGTTKSRSPTRGSSSVRPVWPRPRKTSGGRDLVDPAAAHLQQIAVLRPRFPRTPYNAQVGRLTERLGYRDIAVGTVDKFQGKEAPIVIYSMTTSTPEDAPRGMSCNYV